MRASAAPELETTEGDASCAPQGFVPPLSLSWTALDAGTGFVEGVDASAIGLVATSGDNAELEVELHFALDVGKPTLMKVAGPKLVLEPGQSVGTSLDLQALNLPVNEMDTSGMVVAWATVAATDTGTQRKGAVSPPLFWHYGTADSIETDAGSGSLSVYDERTLEEAYHGGDVLGLVPEEAFFALDGAPVTPSRVFAGDVAIVTEGKTAPEDLVAMGLIDSPEPIVDHFPEDE